MELKQYWAIIRKRMWLIALLVIVSAGLASYYSYFVLEKTYMASTKLIVNQNQSENVLNGDLTLNAINTNIQLAKTYKEIIRTPRIMELVSEEYPELKLGTNGLISRVSVATVDETQVMSIYAVDSSYSRAANIVNAVAEVFKREIPLLMKVDNVNILNQADPEAAAAPVAPNASMNVAISIILSLMIGLGIAFLLDYLDDTIKTEEDVAEVLGLSTFTIIPNLRDKRRNKRTNLNLPTPLRRDGNATIDA